jgi:hypothetical protein
MKPIRAYHFVGKTLRNGQPVPVDGEKLIFDGQPVMCKFGLHASRHPFDALKYAPGPILCLVEMGGTVVEESDKLVCTERTIIRRIDATELLRYFARMQAVSVLQLWPSEPPYVVLDYLMSGDDSLRAAARATAWAAARATAWAAARAAAWAAAGAAAWAAAWAATRDAAGAAAGATAQDAARDAFNELVIESLA